MLSESCPTRSFACYICPPSKIPRPRGTHRKKHEFPVAVNAVDAAAVDDAAAAAAADRPVSGDGEVQWSSRLWLVDTRHRR